MIVRYTLDEYMAGPVPKHAASRRGSTTQDWSLGISPTRAIELARTGDPSVVAKYAADVDTFALANQDESRPRYESSVAGTRVLVPAYLAGSPTCMRRRAKRQTTIRHMGIYVGLVCSAVINAADMMRRGAAIVSLLETLQSMGVSCDLYLVADTHGQTDGDLTQVIQLDTRPLDLARLGFVVAHPAFTRNVTYGVAEGLDEFNGNWSASFTACGGLLDAGKHTPHMRRALGMAETDIYVPPVIYQDTTIKDPQRWIRERVQQALGSHESEMR